MTLYNWIFVSPAHSLAARQMPLRYSVNLVPKVFLRDCYSVGEKLSQQMRSSTAAVIASLPKQPNEEVLHCRLPTNLIFLFHLPETQHLIMTIDVRFVDEWLLSCSGLGKD